MIRTEIVTLTVIPGCAYRQKFTSGGSGVVILRSDSEQPGLASISKTSGDPIPTKNTPAKLFPKKAFREALELTAGLPYKKRGTPTLKEVKDAAAVAAAPQEDADPITEAMAESEAYQKLLETYTDKTGKLSYKLLNKDLIQFAHRSSIVRKMIDEEASLEDIRLHIIRSKFQTVTGTPLTDEELAALSALLDDADPKGVYKELNDELLRKLKK